MVENQFFWKNQETLAPEKYGARDCFVLKSKPGSQDRTHYDSATSWIDRSILFPLHVVKTLRGTGQQKEIHYYGLRKTAALGVRRKWRQSCKASPASRFLKSKGAREGHIWAQDLILASQRQDEKMNKSERLLSCRKPCSVGSGSV